MNSVEAEPIASGPAPENSQAVLDSIINSYQADDTPLLGEDYLVRIPSFEGPLDLLLHLIRKEQLDINDIPVSRICASYLEHLELIKRFDVNLAGEFMVMAATLTLLKSQLLIPREETEEEAEDPRIPLVAQLLEYERFKLAAEQLDRLPWLFRELYPRPVAAVRDIVPKHTPEEAPVEAIETYDLLVCLKSATDRTQRKPVEIHSEAANLRERAQKMGQALAESETMEFRQLLPKDCSRPEMVVSFLAVLELAKLRFVRILQTAIFGPIQIRRVRPIEELDTGLLDQF